MAILRNFKNLFGKKPPSGEPSFFPEDEQTPTSISTPVSKNGPMKAASPEASASDLAAKGTWKAKKARVWKKGSIILGTFRVLDVMSGGMGYIYIAEHMGWKVKMAIKCPNEVILANKEYFARVLREADAWISLGLHPHIAYCYYMRQIDEVPNFFIEYVDGGNLRDWIADLQKSDFSIGLDLAVQFCNGMEYAHSSGMIHRDIKPENILLTNDGLIKITDFGIAMFHNPSEGSVGANNNLGAFEPGDETRITKLGHVMGSPSYMSIEQWKDSRTVDFRADIYSFGVCMYEMFCGKRPFKKTSVEAQENGEEPLNPMAIRKDMPKRLAHTLLRCVSHDKDKRFSSFSDLGAELTKIYREIYSTDPPHKDVADIGLKADGLNNRAVSYTGLGRYNEARALWEKAIKEDPQHFESIFNYGYLRWQNLEVSYDDFVAKVRELERVRGSSPEYWRALAWVALESGDRDYIDSIRQGRNHIEEPDFQTAFEEYQKPIFTPYKRINGDNSNADDILSMVIAHDGRTLLTGSVDGGMRLWDITSGNLLRKFSGHKQQVNAVSMSKDGLHAVSASDDKSAIVWDLSKRKALYVLMGHNSSVLCAQVSPDNASVATGGEDGDIILWDLKSGSKLKTFAGHQGPVNAVRFSPDGRHLVSASDDNSIRLWDVQAGMHMFSFLGHGDSVQDVQFSPNGHYLLSGGADNTVRVWDIEKIAEVRQFKRHNDIVSCVGFSPDGQYIISGGWDKMVSIVKLSTGHGGWQQIHTDKVTSVCFMPGGNYAFSSGHNGKITIWKHNGTPQIRENIHPFPLLCRVQTIAKLGQERQVSRDILAGAKAAIKSGQFKKAYKLLKTGQKIPGYENDREFMDLVSLCANWSKAKRIGLKNAWPLRILKGHSDWVTHVEFTANYRYIVSSSWDQTFRLWDMQNGAQLKQFDKTTNSEIAWNVTSFDFTSDNKVAISGNRNNNLAYLWNFSTGEKMGELRGHDAMVNSVCFSNNHRYALTGSDDKTVRLWDVKSRKEVRRFSEHRQTVFTVKFSPDNKLAVSSSDDATVKLWDLEGNRLIRSFEGHYSSVFSASFSPDGATILSCSEDGTIRLWDIQTGNEVKRFEGHESWVATASFSPDGRFILSGSKDSTIRVWDVASGREVHKFEGHSGWVTCLKFSHDGRFAVSGGWDNNVILWEFDWDWEI